MIPGVDDACSCAATKVVVDTDSNRACQMLVRQKPTPHQPDMSARSKMFGGSGLMVAKENERKDAVI